MIRSLLVVFVYVALRPRICLRRLLSQATPQFLCAEGSGQVTLSGGPTCTHRPVCTPGNLDLSMCHLDMEHCGRGWSPASDKLEAKIYNSSFKMTQLLRALVVLLEHVELESSVPIDLSASSIKILCRHTHP